MESSPGQTPAAALRDAEASRAALARAATPSGAFLAALALAIATQIATTAVGLGANRPLVLAGGLLLFAAVTGVQLLRLRRTSGIWVAGFASRVVLGTDPLTSIVYAAALGAAVWAAFASRWWLVALAAAGGGAAYALAGRRWLARYRDRPQDHAAAESPLELAALIAIALAALVLLLLQR